MSSSASENGYTATEAEKSSSAASAGSSSEIVKASNETGQLKPSEEGKPCCYFVQWISSKIKWLSK